MSHLQRAPNALYDIVCFYVLPYIALYSQECEFACLKVSIQINVLCFMGIDIKNNIYLLSLFRSFTTKVVYSVITNPPEDIVCLYSAGDMCSLIVYLSTLL